jgi:ribosomal protein L21
MAEKTLKKAIITTGGKQYLVAEGDTLDVEMLPAGKNTSFEALLLIDGEKVTVGTPVIDGVKVTADIRPSKAIRLLLSVINQRSASAKSADIAKSTLSSKSQKSLKK